MGNSILFNTSGALALAVNYTIQGPHSDKFCTKQAAETLRINAELFVRVDDAILNIEDDVDLTAADLVPAGSFAVSTTYYVYGCHPLSGSDPDFRISENSTYPDGYTALTSRKIAGFDTDASAEILESSVWDLRTVDVVNSGISDAQIASDANISSSKLNLTAGNLDVGGNSLVACQSVANLAAQGPSLYLNGINDYINLDALAAELVDVTNTEGAIIWKGKIHDFKTDYLRLWGFGDTDAGEYILLDVPAINNTLRFSCAIDGVLKWRFYTDVTFSEDVEYEIVVAQNGISPVMYVNGKIVPVTVGGSADLAAWFANTTGIDNGRIGCTSYDSGGDVNFLPCTINKFHALNVCPTAAEVLAMYEGGNVPYKWIGADMTDLITNGGFDADTDWTKAGAWSIAGGVAAYDNSSVGGLYQSSNFTKGKKYKITFDVTGATGRFRFEGGANIQLLDEVPWEYYAVGSYVVEGTASDDFTQFWIVGNTLGAFNIDNITTTQVGCGLQLEQDGICHSQWLDKSGNKLHGVIDGALPINLSPSHKEQYPHLTSITDDTALADVVPAGYMLNYIVFEGENANDATIDLGTTASTDDVFSQEVITGNDITVVVINKMFSKTAAQSLYLNDDGAGTWNGASLTATLIMKRII